MASAPIVRMLLLIVIAAALMAPDGTPARYLGLAVVFGEALGLAVSLLTRA